MSVLPPDDPHGDRAWAAEQARKKNKGRAALLDAHEWSPSAPDADDPSAGAGEGDGDAGPPAGGGGPDKPKIYKALRMPRIGKDGMIIWVPIDLETGVAKPCPVKPLGVKEGVYYFLDLHGQLIAYDPGKMGQSHIRAIFAPDTDWLNRHFPQFSQNGTWKGFQAQFAQEALFNAAAAKGVFDAREKVRGLGCWRGPNGELVQHLGNVIRIDGEEHKPGEIGEFVYPGRPKLLPPIVEGPREEGVRTAAETVLMDFGSWSWARGETDARLLLGWIGCAILGAALEWRPMVFITGDAGTGKSTLQERLKMMLPGRMASTVDASPAALRQIINQDAIGVSFDEIEADMLSDQSQNVMKLARVAASGGTVFRGGKDHNAAEFSLRGCFAFSAIVPPSMRQQDMQRLTFLRLYQLPKGQKLERWTQADARLIGQKLAGRVVSQFHRWDETLSVYEQALMEKGGHNQRGARQFGTLLAAADLMLHDSAPALDVAEGLIRGLERDALYEYESADPLWLVQWRHILSAQPESWRSDGFPTIAEIVRKFLRSPEGSEDRFNYQRKLNRIGLAVVTERKSGKRFLAIPPKHQRVAEIFAQTDLRAHGGEGSWTSVFRGAPPWNAQAGEGVWRADMVTQLGRVKCTQIRLDATVELQGVRTPIFDEAPEEDS